MGAPDDEMSVTMTELLKEGFALSKKKRIDPDGELWLAVTETTGQPRFV